jgi:hypothetical protein
MTKELKKKVNVEIDNDSEIPEGFSYESYSSIDAEVSFQGHADFKEWGFAGVTFSVPDQIVSFYVTLGQNNDQDSYMFKVKIIGCETDLDGVNWEETVSPEKFVWS